MTEWPVCVLVAAACMGQVLCATVKRCVSTQQLNLLQAGKRGAGGPPCLSLQCSQLVRERSNSGVASCQCLLGVSKGSNVLCLTTLAAQQCLSQFSMPRCTVLLSPDKRHTRCVAFRPPVTIPAIHTTPPTTHHTPAVLPTSSKQDPHPRSLRLSRQHQNRLCSYTTKMKKASLLSLLMQ